MPSPVAPEQTSSPQAYRESPEAVLARLGADPTLGLTAGEAVARLQRYGPNELQSSPATPAWRKFLAQFQSPLVLLLLVAALISFIAWLIERESDWPFETIAILAILLLNAVLGFIQEERAERSVAALKAMSAAMATVIRDGERRRIPAREVVPGDILLVEEGDTIAADARLIEVTGLQVAEAALTGESLPVAKSLAAIREEVSLGDRRNMLFAGTSATYGRARAVVTATGMQTEMGKIAGLLQRTEDTSTPLQAEIERVGRALGLAVIVIAVVIVVAVFLTQQVTTLKSVVDVLIVGVSLAVAAVPEGLATVLTIVLALGMQRMARRNAIVRKLAAVETLGSANVICTDKTGTLTRNEMTVRTVVTASGRVEFSGIGYAPEGCVTTADGRPLDDPLLRAEVAYALRAADLANNSVLQRRDGRWVVQGDPTEGALHVAAAKLGLQHDALARRFVRIGEAPFSSERKLMSTMHADAHKPERVVIFAKGAPDVLLARCCAERVGEEVRPLSDARRSEIQASIDRLAGQALRTLGVAFRTRPRDHVRDGAIGEEMERDLVFLGLIGMIDPPRPEAKDAVARAQQAGIRVIMITGDHPLTAQAIAAELGIAAPGARVMTGAELSRLDEPALCRAVREVSVYARVSPEHKLLIVRALKQNGDVVAMTGDGVNDAPALKQADIGVAMGITGTDVSKEAADMILTDDNFASIVAAVEEGRAIFSNIRKFLRYLLSSNISEVMTMFFGLVFATALGLVTEQAGALVLPLLATQILWINLVTDSSPALALGIDPPADYLMRRPPRPRDKGVIDREMWVGLFFVGAVMTLGTLMVFDYALAGGLIPGAGDLPRARTMAFTTLVLFQLFNVFNARSDRESAFRGLFRNPGLWLAVAVSLVLQVLVVHVPFLQRAFSTVALSPADWLTCIAVASSVVWMRELFKLLARRHRAG
ncbi:MAG: cation-translocating P-type ATPase [Thermoflexales bacterium]|nr:cation-translocating P-type ATPase [Thermoflexales bacterium]MDW8351219.1 cation-translocating P-type ATPase [Anaerolineae bacterium]